MRAALLALARARATDEPAHDILHIQRVARNAEQLAKSEKANADIAVTAALLHELFNYPKGHPDSARSGEVCAEHARKELLVLEAAPAFIDAVCYAIAVHPFSLGVMPTTLEAKILQDADRLDAIGAIGIARCFATTAIMRRPFYSAEDPFCEHRLPSDRDFALDHFYKKLLPLPATMHTAAARAEAQSRLQTMQSFLKSLAAEIV